MAALAGDDPQVAGIAQASAVAAPAPRLASSIDSTSTMAPSSSPDRTSPRPAASLTSRLRPEPDVARTLDTIVGFDAELLHRRPVAVVALPVHGTGNCLICSGCSGRDDSALSSACMIPGGILTAMVTPFDRHGEVDEDATVRLIHRLLDAGSDGLVVAGTTGESPTLTDEEKARLWQLAVEESGDAAVIAGTGTYDTRHSAELTERATEIGVDAVLVVTPVLQQAEPARARGAFRGGGGSDRPTRDPLQHSLSRPSVDMPNDLLAELAQIENVSAVKQARYEDLAPIDGLDLLAGNDDTLARVLDMGGTGGILVASQLVGREMRQMIDEPERRHEIHDSLTDLFEALAVTTNPIPIKAAMTMAGHEVGGLRLPLVEASDDEAAVDARRARAPRPTGAGLTSNGTLRVLPLGGLGEIGKNMTVVGVRRPDRRGGHRADVPDARSARDRPRAARLRVPARARRRRGGDRAHARARGPRGGAAVPAAPVRPRAGDLRRPAHGGDGALEARRAQAQGRPGGGRAGRRDLRRQARSRWRW